MFKGLFKPPSVAEYAGVKEKVNNKSKNFDEIN